MKAFLTKLKNVIIGKELWIRKQCRVPLMWCGNDYGGFNVSPLPDMKNIYSFGIGTDISFDLAIIEKFNVEIFAFDPTPKSIDWIKNKGEIRNFHFYPIGLSNFDENYRIVADYDLMLRIKEAEVNFFPVNAIISNFRFGGASSSRTVWLEMFKLKHKWKIVSTPVYLCYSFAVRMEILARKILGIKDLNIGG